MYGSNFLSKFGKCMGQFSFSPWHIPTKKIVSTPGPYCFEILCTSPCEANEAYRHLY